MQNCSIRCSVSAVLFGLALCSSLNAATFDLPPANENVVGGLQHVTTKYEDTLVDLARRYNIGYKELRIANPEVDPWLPGENTPLVIPTQFILPDAPRKGIVINVSEMRLYYFPKPSRGKRAKVITYPISVGRQDWKTPLGLTRLTQKVKDPTWYPPASIREEHAADGEELARVIPPGPDNPLGRYALQLGLDGYLIHGTNKPNGVGMQVTHGCMRLFPEDIENLFRKVSVGTPVRIVDQPYKAGWKSGRLYLEIHPPLTSRNDQVRDLTPIVKSVVAATRNKAKHSVDWQTVQLLASEPQGIPKAISVE